MSGKKKAVAGQEPVSSPGDKPERILIVDDDRAIRSLLTTVLRGKGNFEIIEAANGVDAQRVLQDQPIDLAIVDLIMPGKSGLELMQWAQERRRGVTWVILSGRGTFDDAVQAVHFGAFDFITKPLASPELLVVTVRNALAQRRMAAERERLLHDIEQRNAQLRQQVTRLEEACRLLCQQQETIDEDLHRAELIQRALLPYDPPPLDGYGLDAIYRPSRNVGGDLYDIVRIGERHLIVYVADAAGHGVSAAMLAVLFKHRIGMTDGRTGLPVQPGLVLGQANRHIHYECSAPGLFVAAAYCLLDLQTGETAVASAGNPPLILLRADGRREMIYHTGPALGLSPEATFDEKTVHLRPGDRLLLYTDGLHEAFSDRGVPHSQTIAETLAGMKGDGWEILHELLDLIAERTGHEAHEDDITLLLLSAGQSASSIDNGQPAPMHGPTQAPASTGANVVIGASEGTTAIGVAGRGSWMHCAAFHEACLAQIEVGLPLTVDLAQCEYLDSTFLGTLQEVVDRADEAGVPLRVQGVRPALRGMFDELGMDRVIRHFTDDLQPLPVGMSPLTTYITDEKNRQRMLLAHEVLASLNEQNRQEFIHLIEHLQAEIQRYERTSAVGST